MNSLITIGSLLSSALIAGLFFAWSNAVMPGFRKLPFQDFLTVMQSCNRVILNPPFLIVFFAPIIFLPLRAYIEYTDGIRLKFHLLLLAAMFYIIGVFIITIIVHIPLNETLDKLNLQQTSEQDLSTYTALFQSKWIPYNTLRTVNAIISFLLLAVSVIEKE